MSATTSECRCGRPTRDDAYVCEDCGSSLARALGDVPAPHNRPLTHEQTGVAR
jgi:hypothetical protein